MRKFLSFILVLVITFSTLIAEAYASSTITAYSTVDHLKVYKTMKESNSALLGTIKLGTKVDVEKVHGKWARIQIGSKTGYVLKKYLNTRKPSETSSSPTFQGPSGTLYITTGDVYIRTKPTTSSTAKKTLYKGSFVIVKATSKGWAKVIAADGTVGYSSMKYLTSVGFSGRILGAYSTKYSTSQYNRASNISLAAGKLSETKITAEGTLSILKAVGPITAESGYRIAPTFANGQLGEDAGGGVCQIATTTYQAALKAGLEIVERHTHSLPVSYVGTGMDATVSWGGNKDLKIRNNTGASIIVYCYACGGKLTVTFLQL